MTDRELLELAAKAVGMDVQRSRLNDPLNRDFLMNGNGVRNAGQNSFPWNPLTDDGDALRLAVTVGLAVIPYPIYAQPKHSVIAKKYSDGFTAYRDDAERIEHIDIYGDDPAAATRRAIVRAAAEIGRGLADKPEGNSK